MRKVNHLTSIASLLVIFFLLAPIVCNFLAPPQSTKESKDHVVSKKASAASKSGIQFPYEEREKEEENGAAKSHDNLFLIYLISESVYHYRAELYHYCSYNALRSCGNASSIPLYLTKRTLLI